MPAVTERPAPTSTSSLLLTGLAVAGSSGSPTSLRIRRHSSHRHGGAFRDAPRARWPRDLILDGSEELKHQVLPDIANGQLAPYALSEREAGAEAAAMRTRATAEGHTWILNGSKSRTTNGAKSSWFTVMAVTDLNGWRARRFRTSRWCIPATHRASGG
jgi:alkylation response protein AidB-like acyl-CoA dehydrogenase